jgi:hypothetical protein
LLSIADLSGWDSDLLSWLGDLLVEVGSALATGVATAVVWVSQVTAGFFTWLWTVTDPIPDGIRAGIAAVVVLTLLALVVRKTRLLMLARTPRVQIGEFTWADPNTQSETMWITSIFHDQLAALEADPLDPLPERAPSAPFVDIVEAVTYGAGQRADLANAAGRLFRALWPVAAYEVWGTLRPSSADNSGNMISIQLIDRGRGNRTVGSESHRRGKWDDAARDAAMTVAGLLYPRVAHKHRGPWAHWKEAIPTQLIGAYYEAQARENASRFEEAMGAYYKALELDPMNPHIRLRIATLQERLGLYLDAWTTYLAIIDEPKLRAWRKPHRRARLIALYRLAILLSHERTLEQWMKKDWLPQDKRNIRDEERIARRRELRMALERDNLLTKREFYFTRGPALASSSGLLSTLIPAEMRNTEAARREWMGSVFAPCPPDERKAGRRERERTVSAVLHVVALRRLEELDAWLRVRPPFRLRQWKEWTRRRPTARESLRRRELSRAAVRVSKLLVRIRIAADAERLAVLNMDELAIIRREHHWLILRWPFPVRSRFRRALHFLAPRRRWADRRPDSWQLHYNAACTVASVLLNGSVLRNVQAGKGESIPVPDDKAIVQRAVSELEEYAFRAGAGRVAVQADWLASGDPDLLGVTGHEEFKLWASHYLPRDLPRRRLRGNVDVNRYTARIVREAALMFAYIWRLRADDTSADTLRAVYWWRQDRAAWLALGKACTERGSWWQRLEAIERFQGWLREAPGPYWVNFAHETYGDLDSTTKVHRLLIERLAGLVGDEDSPVIDAGAEPTASEWARQRLVHVQSAFEAGASTLGEGQLDAARERREALKAARLWTRLAEALDTVLKGERGGEGSEYDPAALLEPFRSVLAPLPDESEPEGDPA